jgi:hypothetical protein
MKTGKLVHLVLTLAFLLVLVSIPAMAADVQAQLQVEWSAPTDGGPVADYAVACTGSFPVDATTVGLSYTSAAIPVTDGQTLAGECVVTARNAEGATSSPSIAYSTTIGVNLPPGAPQNVTITLNCVVVDGTATCEQV